MNFLLLAGAFILASAAFFVAVAIFLQLRAAHQELAELRRRCERIENNALGMERDLTEKIARTAPTGAPVVDASGGFFTEKTVIGEVLAVHPNAREILARFHIGGCSSCAVSETESLGAAARGHAVDLHKLLAALNAPLGSVCSSASDAGNPLAPPSAAREFRAHKN